MSSGFCRGIAALSLAVNPWVYGAAVEGPGAYSDGGGMMVPLLRVAGGLVLVVGLLLGMAWLLRRGVHLRLRRGPAPKLRLLEGRALGHRQSLHVVAFEDRRFLIGSSPAGVRLIAPLPDAVSGDTPALPPTFADALEAAWASRSSGSSS